MTKGSIYIYGTIKSDQSMDGFFSGFTNLSMVKAQIDAINDVDIIEVHIHSVGGDPNEGMAIYNALRLEASKGKRIVTIADGHVASSGTYPFLAGDDRIANKFVKPFIHEMQGSVKGSASDIKNYSDNINALNDMLISFYDERLPKLNRDEISNLLKENTFIEPEDLVNIGFATEIQEVLEPQNIYKPNIEKKMSDNNNSEILKTIQNGFSSIKDILKGNSLDKTKDVENKVINAVSGEQLNFPDVDANAEIQEGDIVNGKDIEDKEYVLDSGNTIINVVNGKVDKIERRVSENELLEVQNKLTDLEKAKNEEIEILKSNHESFKNSVSEKMEVLNKQINTLSGSNHTPGKLDGSSKEFDGMSNREIRRAKRNKNRK